MLCCRQSISAEIPSTPEDFEGFRETRSSATDSSEQSRSCGKPSESSLTSEEPETEDERGGHCQLKQLKEVEKNSLVLVRIYQRITIHES